MAGACEALFGVVLVFLSVVVPNLALLFCFSAVDGAIGLQVYGLVSPVSVSLLGDLVLSIASLVAALLYVLNLPERGFGSKSLGLAFVWCLVLLGSFLKGRRYPYFPMIMVMLNIGVFLGFLRVTLLRGAGAYSLLYRAVAAVSLLCAVGMGTVFIVFRWGGGGRAWNADTRAQYAADSAELYRNIYPDRPLDYAQHCGPDRDISHYYTEVRAGITSACTRANTVLFLVWACPFGGSFANVVVCAFATLASLSPQVNDADASLDLDAEIQRFIKKFVLVLIVVGMCFFAGSYFNGVSLRLGGVFSALLFATLLLLLAWMNLEFGHMQIYRKYKQVEEQIVKRFSFVPPWFINVLRASVLWIFNVLIPMFIVLDILRQKFRRATGKAGQDEGPFSLEGRHFWQMFKPWRWSNVLWWVCFLGEMYFVFQFGCAKITTVFLSWLNAQLTQVPFGALLAICFVVNSAMFLAPPVPGIAVYLFTGIVVTAHANNEENKDDIGFALGCVIAIAVCFGLKMTACCGQYALGHFMGRSVRVQALVGVDKVPTRAIMRILERPGLSVGKVAILVGGPDWPVSVGCGIIKLSIPQMLLGTTPVVLLVAPTVLAGAYLGKVEPGRENMETMLATVLTGVASLTQVVGALLAFYCVVQVATADKEELEKPRPEHAKVEQLARDEAAYKQVFVQVTEWENLSMANRAIIICAAVLVMITCPVFAFCETCFQNFCINCEIDKPLEDHGLDGNVLNLIAWPSGAIALALHLLGILLHLIYTKNTQRLAVRGLSNLREKDVPSAEVIGARQKVDKVLDAK